MICSATDDDAGNFCAGLKSQLGCMHCHCDPNFIDRSNHKIGAQNLGRFTRNILSSPLPFPPLGSFSQNRHVWKAPIQQSRHKAVE